LTTLALTVGLVALWLILAGFFAGIGALVLGKRSGLDDGWPAVHAAFWAGAGVVICTLLTWHLFWPVNGVTFGALAALSGVGWVTERRLVTACLRKRPRWPSMAAIGAMALWVANHALDAAAIDDYLYEYQAIRWNHDFAIVPGLANLHGRLGFNESHHLLGAMLSVGPLAGEVNHVISGLFVSTLLVYLGSALGDIVRYRVPVRGSVLLRALLIGPVAGLAVFTYWGSSISTLKAVVLVTSCVTLLACLLVEFAEAEWATPRFTRASATLLLAGAFAASLKLSAVLFSGVLMIAASARLIVEWRRRREVPARPVGIALGIALLTVALVPVRSVVLSGYPAYPAAMLSTSVDWKVPASQADIERTMITSWARERPTYDLEPQRNWGWIGHWAKEIILGAQFELVMPATLALMCLAAALVPGRRHLINAGHTPAWAWFTLLAACGTALCVWWIVAPSSRFAVGLFWVIAGTSIAWIFERDAWSGRVGMAFAGLVAAAVLALSLWAIGMAPGSIGVIALVAGTFVWLAALAAAGRRGGMVLATLCAVLAFASPADRFASFLIHGRPSDALAVVCLRPRQYMGDWSASYPVVPTKTRSGLILYVTGSTAFDTPLPNTRYFTPYLEQRRPNALGSGFRVNVPVGVAGDGYSIAIARAAQAAAGR
jgi:hypothetical protein